MRFILGIAISLILASCGGATPPTATPEATLPDLANTRWRLQRMIIDGEEHALVDAAPITLEFMAVQLGGSSGCNSYSGQYQVDADMLMVGQVAMTERACPDAAVMQQEQAFARALVGTFAYTHENTTLLLTRDATELHFAPLTASDASLRGVTWQLNRIERSQGGVVSTTTLVRPATLQIDGDWLHGKTGCNTYSSTVSIDGSSLQVEPVAATQAPCPDAAATAQEGSLLQALNTARTFTIVGDVLSIESDGGTLVWALNP